jgi:heterodisulfide reductase subunit A-like polyferredoxin
LIIITAYATVDTAVEAMKEGDQDILRVSLKDPILGETVFIDADVVGLATAIVPASGREELAQFFKVPLNEDGFFMEAHIKLRPVEFPAEGVFVCGLAHNPKFIEESVVQAGAAVSKALTILSKERIEIAKTKGNGWQDYKFTDHEATPEASLRKAQEIGRKAGLDYIYIGNVIGFGNDTYCHNCKKLLVKREYFSVLEYNIKEGRCPYCNVIIPGCFF